MPALVPAGYTRGAILFIGPAHSPVAEAKLLQRFWNEAGAYGSRILIVACAQTMAVDAERVAGILRAWESESVEILFLERRPQAFQEDAAVRVDSATAILVMGGNSLRLTGLLGGTPLAQAIRRANARNKVVCGAGGAASVLCQHMLAPDSNSQKAGPLVHRDLVQFAPGLGLVNRLVLDSGLNETSASHLPISRLLAAIAYNPFLVGVHVEPDTGAVVYPNAVMEVFGENSVIVIDGEGLQHNSLADALPGQAISLLDVRLHVLGLGCTFDFDSRAAAAPAAGDLSLRSEAVKAAF